MENKYIMDVKPITIEEVKTQIKTWTDETFKALNFYASYMDLVISYAEVLDAAVEDTKYPQLFIDSEGSIYYMDDEQHLIGADECVYYIDEYRIISPKEEYEA